MSQEYDPRDRDNLPSRKAIELFVIEQLERIRAEAMNKNDNELDYKAALMENNKYNLVTMTEMELTRSAEDTSRPVISLYQAFTNAWEKIVRSFTRKESIPTAHEIEYMSKLDASLKQTKKLVETQERMYALNERSTIALERIATTLERIKKQLEPNLFE